jgi:hypothetical protein
LLQGWLDIGAMVILSLLCFIWARQTLLGFCLLTCTFISLISPDSYRGFRADTATIPALQASPARYVTLLNILQTFNHP